MPNINQVNRLVASWSARHPELDSRLKRAVALLDNVHMSATDPNVFSVEGSQGHLYTVRVDRANRVSSCTCEDHTRRNDRCKHILACALHEILNETM
jgi:hypothetical protein